MEGDPDYQTSSVEAPKDIALGIPDEKDNEDILLFPPAQSTFPKPPDKFQQQVPITPWTFTEPVEYSWEDINLFTGQYWMNPDGSYTMERPGTDRQTASWIYKLFSSSPAKHILHNVTGVAHPGEMLALIGASGAGKTSLLNVLNFRTPSKLKIQGERLVNGVPIESEFLAAISGYVQQVDIFIGLLTVKEHLMFQAILRMDRNLAYQERVERVEYVLHELGLNSCMNSRIGIPGVKKGISGGERKRLSFAAEILTDPAILFCDEPTSGLDSYSAQNIVEIMQNMTKKGRTIICTIHQPASEIFSYFHKILLLAGGKTAFLGSTDDALEFFEQQGMVCPPTYNPADFFVIHLAINPNPEKEADSRNKVEKICTNFDLSDKFNAIKQAASSRRKKTLQFLEVEDLINLQKSHSIYRASSDLQCQALFWRAWITVWRDPSLYRIRIVEVIVVALFFVFIYFGQELTETGVKNITGVLFLFIMNMTFISIFGVINTFCHELPIYLREQSNRMYRTTFYFLSKTIAETPIHFFIPFVFTSITYFTVHLNTNHIKRYIWCVVIITLVANVASSLGYMISCISNSVQTALSLTPPIIVPFLLFGGIFLDAEGTSPYLNWFEYTSFFRYAAEAILINQWDDDGLIMKCLHTSSKSCPYSGTFILKGLKFDKNNFYRDLICLIILAFVFRLFAYIALRIRSYLLTRLH